MDSIHEPILEKGGALDAECDMCSQIVEFLTGSFSRSDFIELGIVGDLLAQTCPHAEWLRHLKYNYGTVPYYETRDLLLNKWKNQRGASLGVCYLTKNTQCSSTTRPFELVYRPEIPQHPGTAIVLDRNWVGLNLIKDWPDRCMKAHSDRCNKTLGNLAPFKPQYLIDVTRYCIVSSTEAFPRFVALSYTWGQTRSFRTTMSKKEQLEKPGSLNLPRIASQVPNTIRDAIELTRLLGENWLWVDSLCIVQDDPVALGHELKQMHRIYASSFLTIIAKDGHNADYGLRGLYGISSARCTKQSIVRLARDERLSFMETNWPNSSSTIYDYTQRMWTFQEQVFSKRCLTFESGYVTWQCNCANWTEHQTYHPEADGSLEGDLHQFKHLMVPHVPALNNLATLVKTFNGRSLNFEENVFDTFSGFHTHLNGLYPSGLVFGHPELYFDISLCCSSLFRHRLPSWSWMGWHGYTVFPSDSEHEFQPRSYTGFTDSVTEFYVIESPRASIRKRVDCTWSQLGNANIDHMPSGWKRTRYEPPTERSHSIHTDSQCVTDVIPLSTSKELPSYLYSHTTGGDNPDLYWYPVPVADSSSGESTEHRAYREYQYLRFQTTKAYLFMSVESISDGSSKLNLIKDTNGNTVGGLRINSNEESEVLHEGISVELIAIVKGWTTIFKDSESGFLESLKDQVRLLYERPELLTKEEEEKEWHDITNRSHAEDEMVGKGKSESDKEGRQDCYHVLRVEQEDQVSYRKRVGFVLADDWERLAGSTKIEVVLG
ncbi:unnamed protein product [Fusarium equiseti]|uniref:Heterokaryon incompatibility domain-containing protein n=1 Tax=Fusarium equiseti TaxID=61235 RepID=A0A8J2IEG3_FUSEQ|nr:unnamed protein product [Fusarium equiseti]